MLVYVQHKDGTPLMPCKPSKARKLLRDKKARCVCRTPFTIRLNWDSTKHVQKLVLGVDMGSRNSGFAVRKENNQVVYLSEVESRQDIVGKMDTRRNFRRTRRNRKTRYRKCRFLNRKNSTKNDRYPPSIRSKYDSIWKEIKYICCKILPIDDLVIETATFDPHLMQNYKLAFQPWMYQKGLKFGYRNTAHFVLKRDNYTCQKCRGKKKDSKLQVHHVLYRSQGGSDRPNNLITLCKTCHHELHLGLFSLTKRNTKSLLSHATHMNVLQSMFRKRIQFREIVGSFTKTIRQHFGIPKEHCFDAVCCSIKKNIVPELLTNRIFQKKCIGRGNYKLTNGIRSEKTIPKGKINGFKRWDTVLHKGIRCFVKGRMSSGYMVLCNILGQKLNFRPMPKPSTTKRLTSRKSWIIAELVIQSS